MEKSLLSPLTLLFALLLLLGAECSPDSEVDLLPVQLVLHYGEDTVRGQVVEATLRVEAEQDVFLEGEIEVGGEILTSHRLLQAKGPNLDPDFMYRREISPLSLRAEGEAAAQLIQMAGDFQQDSILADDCGSYSIHINLRATKFGRDVVWVQGSGALGDLQEVPVTVYTLAGIPSQWQGDFGIGVVYEVPIGETHHYQIPDGYYQITCTESLGDQGTLLEVEHPGRIGTTGGRPFSILYEIPSGYSPQRIQFNRRAEKWELVIGDGAEESERALFLADQPLGVEGEGGRE